MPALSQSYLNNKPESIRILDYIFAGPFGTIQTLVFLLYSAGFILFGVAIWRSGVLSRWAGVLLAIHAPLPSTILRKPWGAETALSPSCQEDAYSQAGMPEAACRRGRTRP